MTTTPTQKPTIQPHSYLLAKAMGHVQNAATYIHVLISDSKPSGKAKVTMKEWLRMLKRIKMDAYESIPMSSRNIFDAQVLSDDLTLQIDGITDMILELPPAKRTEIEKYVELQHDIYKQTQ